jgi:ribosomal protein S18 acetylase RimI-like enzyme
MLTDLQAYLRRVAALQYETVALPGLTLYFHPRDNLTFFNYAVPDAKLFDTELLAGWDGDLDASLAQMRAECAARGRRPRFEFIHEYAPELDVKLRAAGFVEEARQQLMVCTADRFCAAPPVPGLEIIELDDAAPWGEIRVFLTVQQRGFDPEGARAATETEARRFAQTLGQGRAFVARLQSVAVAAGMYSAPLDVGPRKTRISEIAGLATLAPFRRRGIATALTACAVQRAFGQGVDVVCLVAADERAGRVYERVGFDRCATMLAYVVS